MNTTMMELLNETNKAVDANIETANMPYATCTVQTSVGVVSCYLRPKNDNRISNRQYSNRVAQWMLDGKVISKAKLAALLS